MKPAITLSNGEELLAKITICREGGGASMGANKAYLGLTVGSLIGSIALYNTNAFLAFCFFLMFIFCFYTQFRF